MTRPKMWDTEGLYHYVKNECSRLGKYDRVTIMSLAMDFTLKYCETEMKRLESICPTPHCVVKDGIHYFERMYFGLFGYEPDEAKAYDDWRRAHGRGLSSI